MQPGCTIEGVSRPCAPLWPSRLPCSSPLPAAVVSECASDSRGWPSGSRPSGAIPGIASPGTHQRISDSPASSIALPELRRDIALDPQTARLSSRSFAFSQARISSILSRTNKSPPAIEVRLHHRQSVSPQARQANQGRSLPADGSGSFQSVAGYQDRDPDEGS